MIKRTILFLSLFMLQVLLADEAPAVRILIVGAGPSGLSIAKALQNHQIYPDIIEKEPQIRLDGAGIAIPANGSWALEKLGINISTKALRIHHMQFTDDQGELLIQERIDHLHPEHAQFYSLSRDQLLETLLSSLNKKSFIQTSLTIKNFSEENDLVKVQFSNGEIKYYDLVIGCDGIYSSLRHLIHPEEVPEFLGLVVWRAVIDAPDKIVMPTYMLGADRLILLYPLPDHKIYVYGHLFQPVKHLPFPTFSQVFAHFGGFVPNILSYLNENKIKFYIHFMEKSHSVRFKLDSFNRILIVGDAAHAFGPMLQNGAAQAFEDAYVLQELFEEITNPKQISSLINEFEKRRRERVEKISALSNIKIQAISDPQHIQHRNKTIREWGAPNVNGFKLIMQENP